MTLHPRLDSDLLMAAALLHDVGKAREFTYGAEIGLTEEGRLLGHLADRRRDRRRAPPVGWREQRRAALLSCVLCPPRPGRRCDALLPLSRGDRAPPAQRARRQVKGALEHGIG